jgi:hypothetical protein
MAAAEKEKEKEKLDAQHDPSVQVLGNEGTSLFFRIENPVALQFVL